MTKNAEKTIFNVSFLVFFIPGLLYVIIHLGEWIQRASFPWGVLAWFVVGFAIYLIADWSKYKRNQLGAG